jgi:hypothetical protein
MKQKQLPKITICNVNPYTTEYAYNLTQTPKYDESYLLDEEKQKLGHNLLY